MSVAKTPKMKLLKLAGDQRALAWQPFSEQMRPSWCKARNQTIFQAKLLSIISAVNSKLTVDVDVLIMFTFLHDLTSRIKDSSVPGNLGLIKALRHPNLHWVAKEVAEATKMYKAKVPHIRVIWTLPYDIDCLKFNVRLVKGYNQEPLSEREIRSSEESNRLFKENVHQLGLILSAQYPDIEVLALDSIMSEILNNVDADEQDSVTVDGVYVNNEKSTLLKKSFLTYLMNVNAIPQAGLEKELHLNIKKTSSKAQVCNDDIVTDTKECSQDRDNLNDNDVERIIPNEAEKMDTVQPSCFLNVSKIMDTEQSNSLSDLSTKTMENCKLSSNTKNCSSMLLNSNQIDEYENDNNSDSSHISKERTKLQNLETKKIQKQDVYITDQEEDTTETACCQYYTKVPHSQRYKREVKSLIGLQYIAELSENTDKKQTYDKLHYVCILCKKQFIGCTLLFKHAKSVPHQLKCLTLHCPAMADKYKDIPQQDWKEDTLKEFNDVVAKEASHLLNYRMCVLSKGGLHAAANEISEHFADLKAFPRFSSSTINEPLVFPSVAVTPSTGSVASDVCEQSAASNESTSDIGIAVMSSETRTSDIGKAVTSSDRTPSDIYTAVIPSDERPSSSIRIPVKPGDTSRCIPVSQAPPDKTPGNVLSNPPTPSNSKSHSGIIKEDNSQSEATKPIKVLLVGGANTVECWPTSEISDDRFVCTAFSQNDSSLAALIRLAGRNLTKDTELLVMYPFAEHVLYEDKSGFLFAQVNKDLIVLQTLVNNAIRFWRIQYPNLSVIWVLPHVVNLVQFNLSKITDEDKTDVVKKSAEATILYERNVSQLSAKLADSECFPTVFDSRAFTFESTLSDGFQLSADSMRAFVSKLGFFMVSVMDDKITHLKMEEQEEKNMTELKAARKQGRHEASKRKKDNRRSNMVRNEEASDSQESVSKRQRLDCSSKSLAKKNSLQKMAKHKQKVTNNNSRQGVSGRQQNAVQNRSQGIANQEQDMVQTAKECAKKISAVFQEFVQIMDKFARDGSSYPGYRNEWKQWKEAYMLKHAHTTGTDVNTNDVSSLWEKERMQNRANKLNNEFCRHKLAIVKKSGLNCWEQFEHLCKLHKIQYVEDQKIPINFSDLVITAERRSNDSNCSFSSNTINFGQDYNYPPTGGSLRGSRQTRGPVPPHAMPARVSSYRNDASYPSPEGLSSVSLSLVHPTPMQQPYHPSSQLPETSSSFPADSRLTSGAFTHAGPSNITVEPRSLLECFSSRYSSLDHSSRALPYQRGFQPSETQSFDAVYSSVTSSTTSVTTNIIAIEPRSSSDQFSVSSSSEEQSVNRDVVECLTKLNDTKNFFPDSKANITEMFVDAVSAEVLSENPMNIFHENAKHILAIKKVFDTLQIMMDTRSVSSNVTNCYSDLCWLLDEIRKKEFWGIDVFKLAKETEESTRHVVVQKLNNSLQNARISLKALPEVKIFLHDLVGALHERAIQDRIKKVVSKLHKSAAVDSREIIDQPMNSRAHASNSSGQGPLRLTPDHVEASGFDTRDTHCFTRRPEIARQETLKDILAAYFKE